MSNPFDVTKNVNYTEETTPQNGFNVWLHDWYAAAPVGSVPEQQDYSESIDTAQRNVAGRKGRTK